jgi:hypothetical protein
MHWQPGSIMHSAAMPKAALPASWKSFSKSMHASMILDASCWHTLASKQQQLAPPLEAASMIIMGQGTEEPLHARVTVIVASDWSSNAATSNT